ncbi:MAG: hypothetical protein QOF19_2518 [Alphaproteobacteria bacterium]|nr:hypothetical protein [Alphaproteobacteria bacterium]
MTMYNQAKATLFAIGGEVVAFSLLLLSLSAAAFVAPASAQNADPYQFKKEAFKPDGTPWTGPVHVGDIINYVLSYKPGTTSSGPVTIDDTLSPNLTYVAPTKASDSSWTWSSSPYSIGHHEQYKHPGFGPGTGKVKVTVTGVPTPVSGTGDGTIPIPIQSLNKVFGVFHHAGSPAEGKIDCWDLTTLAKCGTAQPNATSGFLNTPYTPQSVVRGTTIYFVGYDATNKVSIGCFNGSTQTACAAIPLPATVTNRGDLAGLVEENTSNTARVFAAVKDKVFCVQLPAATTCPGWPAGGFVSITAATSPNYPSNVSYVSMEYGTSPTRLYIHHGNAVIQCLNINLPTPCAGSWTTAGTKIAGQNDGIMLSSLPLSGSSGDGGVCLWKQPGGQVGCLTNLGAAISSTPGSVLNPALSSFRLPNSGRVFFPTHGAGGPKCFDYSGSTGGACAGFTSPTPPPNGLQYGFALDPSDPAKCMLTLGDRNVLWRFDYHTGGIAGCGKPPVTTPDIKELYCNGTPNPATFQWNSIRVLTPGATGTLTIIQGTSAPITQTVSFGTTTPMPSGIGPGYGPVSFSYLPNSGSPLTVDLEIGYVSDKNPQICYQTRVDCGPVFNDAVFKGSFNGSPVNVSRRVDLGKVEGAQCSPPEFAGCLKDMKVEVKCNPNGTYTVVLNGAGFTGNEITLASETAGVTVSPSQQPWSPTTTWTLAGATPGQTVTLTATATQVGGGTAPDTDLCCTGEIKITMPDCPKPSIDVKVDKENTPTGGPGNGFNVWVTNVGSPITFGPGELIVKDVIPPGLTISTQSSLNWTCLPVPATGPATITCTYNLAGSLGTGASLLDSLVFAGFLTITDQPLKNCAIVSIAAHVGIDTNPSNDQACVTITKPAVGSLVVKKVVEYQGPIALPTLVFPVTVTCGGPTTTGNVTVSTPLTVNNIPVPNTCTVIEGVFPTPPPGVCPGGTVPTWSAPTYTPASVPITAGATATITVHNSLHCEKIVVGDKIDLAIEKTGGTSPVPQVNGYAFHLKVTNVGSPFTGTNAITVKDVVPAGMTFNAATGLPDWTCNAPPAIPAGGTLTCTYSGTGPTTSGQVFSTINITATALGSAPFPPFTNCATVGPTPTSGPVDANSGDNKACVTVTKPTTVCLPPMISGPIPGICVCPTGTTLVDGKCVPQTGCAPPMISGPIPGVCVCPAGTTLVDGKCVPQTGCTPPMISGPIPGVCVCPPGTVQKGRECVRTIECRSPLVPNTSGTACVCPAGLVQKGRECVLPIVCAPPKIPNGAGTACVCQPGYVQRGRECVRRLECEKPAVPNRAGTACICPPGYRALPKGCVRVERDDGPRITPGDIIRVLPGLIPDGGGRGNPESPRPDRGGGESPGRR